MTRYRVDRYARRTVVRLKEVVLLGQLALQVLTAGDRRDVGARLGRLRGPPLLKPLHDGLRLNFNVWNLRLRN